MKIACSSTGISERVQVVSMFVNASVLQEPFNTAFPQVKFILFTIKSHKFTTVVSQAMIVVAE